MTADILLVKVTKKAAPEIPIQLKKTQILLLGTLAGAGAFYGSVENGQFNTFINGVLRFEIGSFWAWWMVPLMTSFSALMGLIFMLVWGAYSDNYFSRWGHRKPFLLAGIVAGIAMLLYLLSTSFWLCFFLDVFIIGIFMNAVLAANNSLIPEMTKQGERGRVNARVNVISGLFGIISMGLFLLADALFSFRASDGQDYLNHEGHFWLIMITCLLYITITVGCFFGIKEPALRPTTPANKSWYKEISSSFQFAELRKQKEFFKIILATLVFNIAPKIFLPWIFEFFTKLPINMIIIAIAAGIYLFCGFGISLLLGKFCDARGRKMPLIVSIMIGSIGFMLVPLLTVTLNYILLIVVIVLILFILNGVPTILGSWTQDLLPLEKIGQFTGINNISSTINQFIGVWIGGVVYMLTGGNIAWNMCIAGFVYLASIPFFLLVKETLGTPAAHLAMNDGTPVKEIQDLERK